MSGRSCLLSGLGDSVRTGGGGVTGAYEGEVTLTGGCEGEGNLSENRL